MTPYQPIFELTRGETVESIHDGAIAVVDVYGKLLAWYGDPDAITFLRSSAKPFQAMPFIEKKGHEFFHLTQQEVALLCASHSGTDEHVAVARSIQEKVGISEAELLCGTHPPYDVETVEMLRSRNEKPTSNRHNCSGKHSGMLAFTRLEQQLSGRKQDDLEYIDRAHPIQQEILQTFAEMCCLPVSAVHLGTDGCSAPNFAVPIWNAALAFARLCGPETASDPKSSCQSPITPARARACTTITAAMTAYPFMIAGPRRFDTRIMEIGKGRIVSKAGAEGFQGIGLMPGVLAPGAPAVGIAFKVGDGDIRAKVRPAVAVEVLRQLGVLDAAELQELSDYGPVFSIENWRKIRVGVGRPCFRLRFNSN